MNDAVLDYTKAAENLFRYFRCPANYVLKSLVHMRWRIWEEDDVSFLTYWNENTAETSLFMARKDGRLLLYKTKEYTLAIAIDCVKMGFILSNSNEYE